MRYFIANWKANKNINEALLWIDVFLKQQRSSWSNSVRIVICPPYPLLYPLSEKIKKMKNIYLGVQNLSIFDNGSFTGEVTAKMVEGLVQYSIIGHSERRKYFSETEDQIEKKIIQAKKHHIEPILCVRDENDKIFPQAKIVAYEPIYAIGTGLNEPPEKVLVKKQRLNLQSNTIFLYGGSVNETNIEKYLATDQINGFLVGNASLDPLKFAKIINSNQILENKRKENKNRGSSKNY